MTVFNECTVNASGDLEATLECVANWMEKNQQEQLEIISAVQQNSAAVNPDDLTSWLLTFAGALGKFLGLGFSTPSPPPRHHHPPSSFSLVSSSHLPSRLRLCLIHSLLHASRVRNALCR